MRLNFLSGISKPFKVNLDEVLMNFRKNVKRTSWEFCKNFKSVENFDET